MRFSCQAAALLVFLTACTGSVENDAEPVAAMVGAACIPGFQIECTCADQRSGVAVCNAQGSLGACACTPTTPGVLPGAAQASQGSTSTPLVPDMSGGGAVAMEPVVPPAPPLASAVRISQLAWYQPVKIPLVEKGVEIVERIAPVIARKRALLRVFVETLPGWAPRDLTASLALSSASGAGMPIAVTARIERSSTDADLESTLNIELPDSAVAEGVRYAVELQETSAAMPAAGATIDPDARWPKQAGELADLGAREAGPFRVVVVPYRYQGDRSGRLPATGDAEMAKYHDYLQVLYPASEVQLTVHEPVDFDQQLGPQTGWSEWLDRHCELRTMEDPDPKVFYYGMMAPRASWRDYGGGVAGVSNLPGPNANFGRCSVGIGFEGFAFVAAHELGHALGLEHAPCGTSGGAFPYEDAKTGVWGYDFAKSALVDPDEAHDLMSYCDPPFMSDYNYRRLFARIRYLNLQFDILPTLPVMYQRVLIDSDGTAKLREPLQFTLPPGGPEEMRSITMLDSAGQPTAQSSAYYFPFSLPGAGVWLIPHTGLSSARIDGIGDIQLY